MGMLSSKYQSLKKNTPHSYDLRSKFVIANSGKTFQLQRHSKDSGSTEVQISRQTARIAELTEHLKQNKQDHATKRGLTKIIGKRLGMLRYLNQKDRAKYLHVCAELGLKKLANN